MNYEFEILKTKYGNFLEMNFIGDGNINILSALFNSSNMTVEDNKEKWIKSVDKVINGKSSNEDIELEAFDINIENGKTFIFFDYPANGEHEFELPTIEFKEILEVWFNKLKEFEEHGKLLD